MPKLWWIIIEVMTGSKTQDQLGDPARLRTIFRAMPLGGICTPSRPHRTAPALLLTFLAQGLAWLGAAGCFEHPGDS